MAAPQTSSAKSNEDRRKEPADPADVLATLRKAVDALTETNAVIIKENKGLNMRIDKLEAQKEAHRKRKAEEATKAQKAPGGKANKGDDKPKKSKSDGAGDKKKPEKKKAERKEKDKDPEDAKKSNKRPKEDPEAASQKKSNGDAPAATRAPPKCRQCGLVKEKGKKHVECEAKNKAAREAKKAAKEKEDNSSSSSSSSSGSDD